MAKCKNKLGEVLEICKALADPNRLRILMSFQKRELCVCEITEMLGLAPSTVSKHLLILKQAGLVTNLKRGRWIYYSLVVEKIETEPVLNWLRSRLRNDDIILKDKNKLRKILSHNYGKSCCEN